MVFVELNENTNKVILTISDGEYEALDQLTCLWLEHSRDLQILGFNFGELKSFQSKLNQNSNNREIKLELDFQDWKVLYIIISTRFSLLETDFETILSNERDSVSNFLFHFTEKNEEALKDILKYPNRPKKMNMTFKKEHFKILFKIFKSCIEDYKDTDIYGYYPTVKPYHQKFMGDFFYKYKNMDRPTSNFIEIEFSESEWSVYTECIFAITHSDIPNISLKDISLIEDFDFLYGDWDDLQISPYSWRSA